MKTISMPVYACLLTIGLAIAAQASNLGEPLPDLEVNKLGELVLKGPEIDYLPWRSDKLVPKVHVLQYIPGTMSASKRYSSFTDHLIAQYELNTYHVTTIIDMDAAMWGTSGFVISEVEKSKREFPQSTLVLDKAGAGVSTWDLGEKGSGLFILDEEGVVRFALRDKMDKQAHDQAKQVFADLMQR
jgi:uncharacterized protein